MNNITTSSQLAYVELHESVEDSTQVNIDIQFENEHAVRQWVTDCNEATQVQHTFEVTYMCGKIPHTECNKILVRFTQTGSVYILGKITAIHAFVHSTD